MRIYERSHGKQRSIFLKKDELVWLEHTVEEMVLVESSKVFWDQLRAGYPRMIAQRCSNRHGSFLTVEEFDGRRRCGTILIPEGRYGQGWKRFILEIYLANSSSLCEVRDREIRKDKEVKERRSYAEVMGLKVNQVEECFGPLTEPIARVPRWLREASAGLLKPGQEVVMHTRTLSKNQKLGRPPINLVKA